MAGGTASASAPWKTLLLKALDSNSHLKHSAFFQLATVGSNGRPANRTMVFRGFQENCDKIQINTDARSSKIEDIKYCSFGEICWYFTDSWEQFRISGRIDIINGSNLDPLKLQASQIVSGGHISLIESTVYDLEELIGIKRGRIEGEQRQKAWFASSPKSRLQYLGPIPGLPVITENPGAENQLDPSTGPVDAFCLLILDPEQVDYLNLKSNERLMFTSRPSANGCKVWIFQKVNP